MWNEEVEAQCDVLSHDLYGERKIERRLTQISYRFRIWDWNPEPPEYDAGVFFSPDRDIWRKINDKCI
jgi:hypothetical protein